MHQGEQLDNTETKLDQINQDMKTSQRHINNIKSVFGGFKNWWSGKKEATTKEPVKSERSDRLEATLDISSQAQVFSHLENFDMAIYILYNILLLY